MEACPHVTAVTDPSRRRSASDSLEMFEKAGEGSSKSIITGAETWVRPGDPENQRPSKETDSRPRPGWEGHADRS